MEPRYGHFNQLVEVSMKMLDQKISIGEFEETLNRIIANIRIGYSELDKIEVSNSQSEAALDLQRAREGMALFEIGVQEMRKYIDVNERQYLLEGLKIAQKGSRILNDIIKLHDYEEDTSTQD